MYIEQMYTGCLAEAAYYIESNNEAIIIDPLRETTPYTEKAAQRGDTIKYIFETHFHADFVSGHVDLARETGATIVYGPTAETGYDTHIATDGEEFKIGELTLRVLHTPGHTPESSTYLLIDAQGNNHAIFSGDTLFIGDVGRPDLAIAGDITQEALAGMLFDSLRNKIMPLEDKVIVYPAHGAGSSCGKNMSAETFDSLGHQKETNYALRADMTRAEFIKEVTEGILPPPQYFPLAAMLNKNGYDKIDDVMERGFKAMHVSAVEGAIDAGCVLIDTRDRGEFIQGFIPGAVFVGLDGNFATWVGTVIPDNQSKIVVIAATPEKAEEAVLRLARVGYDHAIGYLEGGYEAWTTAGKATDSLDQITATQLQNLLSEGAIDLLDVRKPAEWEAEQVPGAINYPLNFINDHLHELDNSKTWHVHCLTGYRSVITASILKREGYNIIDVAGGMEAILNTAIKTTEFVCPSTLG
jgi:hydroxyacylglutathione hydrolase